MSLGLSPQVPAVFTVSGNRVLRTDTHFGPCCARRDKRMIGCLMEEDT